MATSGFRLEIFNDIFPKHSINSRKDSPFSCHIFTNAREVRWCGLLVANWMPKRVTNVSKQSIELGGNRVNQLSAGPFRDVGNTRQRIASSEVYNPTWVVNTSTCSSRSVVPSYWLIVNPFQCAGSSTSMISSTKGWRLAVLGLALVWWVVVCTLNSSRHVSPSPSPLLWDSSLCWEFFSSCLRNRWFSSLRAFISSSFLCLNSSNWGFISRCNSAATVFWSTAALVDTILLENCLAPRWAPIIPDRYYFSAEPYDLKNPLCWISSCSSLNSSWISLPSALRRWGYLQALRRSSQKVIRYEA